MTMHVQLDSPGFETAVQLVAYQGHEQLSHTFSWQLEILCPDGALDPRKVVGERACISFERSGALVRRIYGIFSECVDLLETEPGHTRYQLRLVPRLWRSNLVQIVDIYMDMSVPEIIALKLSRVALKDGDDFSMRLLDTYPKREFVVQYEETDLAFVSRLCEHDGIAFSFEHDDGHDKVIFSDDNSAFRPLGAHGEAPFYPRGEKAGIFRLQHATRMIPKQYIQRDYNYRTPDISLTASAKLSGGHAGAFMEYGGHFKTPDEGARLALVRAQERTAKDNGFDGESVLPELTVGARVTVTGHRYGEIPLLLTQVHHRGQQAWHAAAEQQLDYENSFTAIGANTPFRPERNTPKPRISGFLTGVVEAPEDSEYADVDAQGRYRVRFLFDATYDGERQASRPIRMMQPHSGPGYGMHFPLRGGVEVLIAFVGGDPDRPLIAGTVPNPRTQSPVTEQNRAKNVIRTGGGNQIDIDDTKGAERIKLSTPSSDSTIQLGSPNAPEQGIVSSSLAHLTSVGGIGINALSTFNTTLSSVVSTMGNHVTNVAGKLTTPATVSMWLGIGDTVLNGIGLGMDIVDAGMDIWVSVAATHVARLRNDLKASYEDFITTQKELTDALNKAQFDKDSPEDKAREAIRAAIENHSDKRAQLEERQSELAELKEKQQALALAGQLAAAAALNTEIAAKEADVSRLEGETTNANTTLEEALTKYGSTFSEPIKTKLQNYKGKPRAYLNADEAFHGAADYLEEAQATVGDDSWFGLARSAGKTGVDTFRAILGVSGTLVNLYSTAATIAGRGIDAYAAVGSNILGLEARRQFLGIGGKLSWGAAALPVGDTYGQLSRVGWTNSIPALTQVAGSLKGAFSPQWGESRQIIGSEDHTVIFAKKGLLMSGQTAVTVSSRDRVLVTANDQAIMHSRGDTEVAGKDVKISAHGAVDVRAGSKIQLRTPGVMDALALGSNRSQIESVGDLRLQSRSNNIEIFAKQPTQQINIIGGEVLLAAKKTAKLSAMTNLTATVSTSSLDMKSTGVTLKNGSNSIAVTPVQVQLEQGAAKVQLSLAGVKISAQVFKAEAGGNNITLSPMGAQVNGSIIQLG